VEEALKSLGLRSRWNVISIECENFTSKPAGRSSDGSGMSRAICPTTFS